MRSWTLLLTLALALAGCQPENARVEIRPVRTVLVDPKPVLDGRQAVGEVKPRYESDLSFRVTGKLVARRVDVGEPLQVREPLVKFEFIRMPDSTGFGDYTESGQVIPVSLRGRKGSYSHCMFLNDHPPIAGGREVWGFPKKLASSHSAHRDRYPSGHARLRSGSRCHCYHGLQTQNRRSCVRKGLARGTELSAQDHPPCRPHAAYLRARRVLPEGCRSKGSLDRSVVAQPLVACPGTCCGTAGPGGRLRGSAKGFTKVAGKSPHAHSRHSRQRFKMELLV